MASEHQPDAKVLSASTFDALETVVLQVLEMGGRRCMQELVEVKEFFDAARLRLAAPIPSDGKAGEVEACRECKTKADCMEEQCMAEPERVLVNGCAGVDRNVVDKGANGKWFVCRVMEQYLHADGVWRFHAIDSGWDSKADADAALNKAYGAAAAENHSPDAPAGKDGSDASTEKTE